MGSAFQQHGRGIPDTNSCGAPDRRARVRSDGCVAGGDAAGRLAWLSRVPEPVVAERPGSCGSGMVAAGNGAMLLVMDILPLDDECGIGCVCVPFDWYTGVGFCFCWWW